MKKEIVMATAIAGLLASVSVEARSINMRHAHISKQGKVVTSKQNMKRIKKNRLQRARDKAFGFGCNNNCADGKKSLRNIRRRR